MFNRIRSKQADIDWSTNICETQIKLKISNDDWILCNYYFVSDTTSQSDHSKTF